MRLNLSMKCMYKDLQRFTLARIIFNFSQTTSEIFIEILPNNYSISTIIAWWRLHDLNSFGYSIQDKYATVSCIFSMILLIIFNVVQQTILHINLIIQSLCYQMWILHYWHVERICVCVTFAEKWFDICIIWQTFVYRHSKECAYLPMWEILHYISF
jgi:hypothetical protein